MSSQKDEQTLTEALFEAIAAAESVYTDSEWTKWAHTCKGSLRLERGAALEASAIACAEADEKSGPRHLAAFHAATAVAWAAGGEEKATRQSCQFAKRNAARAKRES